MPVIPEYLAGDLGLRPTETGIDTLQQGARRIGAFASQRAEASSQTGQLLARGVSSTVRDVADVAEGYAVHKELSQGGVAYAKTLNGLTSDYNATIAQAMQDDPDKVEAVGKKFLAEKLEPALENFGKAFNTEKGSAWAQTRIDNLRNHFAEKAQADVVTAAGSAAQRNIDTVVSTLTNTAYQDGHSVDQTLKDLPDLIHSQTSQLEAIAGAKGVAHAQDLLRKAQVSVIAAGVKGAIERSSDPEATAAEWTKKYPEFINGAEAGTLARAARTQQKFNAAEDRAAKAEQKQQEVQDFNKGYNQLELEALSTPGGPGPGWYKKLTQLMDKPGAEFSKGAPAALYGVAERIRENPPEGAGNPEVIDDLRRRAMKPAEDPDGLKPGELGERWSKGDINRRQWSMLNEIQREVANDPKYKMAQQQFSQFLEAQKPSIMKSNMITNKNPVEGLLYGQFQDAAHELFRQAYNEGGYTAAMKVLRADNPDYIGKILPRFILGTKEGITATTNYMRQGAGAIAMRSWRDLAPVTTMGRASGLLPVPLPPRHIGETPREYLARTGASK